MQLPRFVVAQIDSIASLISSWFLRVSDRLKQYSLMLSGIASEVSHA